MEVASETAWLWEWHAVLPGLPWQLTCGFQVHSWSEFLGLGEILPCVFPCTVPHGDILASFLEAPLLVPFIWRPP